jgi:tRNA dimethylallyltransferase
VGLWQERVVGEIEAVHDQGKLPIVTGGTGLYFRALTQGLAQIPDIEQTIHDGMGRRLKTEGSEALYRELTGVDPKTAARISATDSQRLTRALEVYHGTGRALSAWIEDGNAGVPAHLTFHALVVQPPRDILYDTINARFETMLDEGALHEVRHLATQGFDPLLPIMKAVGVRELIACTNQEISLSEAITRSQKISRNYAKRQLTWFRNQMPEAEKLYAQYSESLKPEIFSFIRQFVLT